jgi:CheY-like chemotaxis protein
LLPKVLLVDDDKPTTVLCEHYLRDICKLDIALNGESAVNLINSNSYSLILMDINLRGEIDGLAITKHLRASEKYKEVPIIAVTAFGKYYKEDAVSAGCNYFLIKPFERKELQDMVSEALKALDL